MTEQNQNTRKMHPLMVTAAVAVIVVCAVATAAMLGILPGAGARSDTSELQLADQGTAVAQLSGEPALAGSTAVKGAAPSTPTKVGSAKIATPPPVSTASTSGAAGCTGCGVVEHVREVPVPTGRASGGDQYNLIGTLAGGVAGGVVGNQFGGGSGKDALTVLGAVGGALAGREVQKNMRGPETVNRYQTQVRMDDGSTRTFTTNSVQFASGDHVRVVDNRLQAR